MSGCELGPHDYYVGAELGPGFSDASTWKPVASARGGAAGRFSQGAVGGDGGQEGGQEGGEEGQEEQEVGGRAEKAAKGA